MSNIYLLVTVRGEVKYSKILAHMETFRRKEALYLEIRSSHGSLMRLSSSHVMFVVEKEGVIPK